MAKDVWVLGLSCSHNGSACLMKNDRIVVAIQEERLTGVKRQHLHPETAGLSVQYCLNYAGIQLSDLDLVVCTALPINGSAKNRIQLNPRFHGVRTLEISHHFAHAVSVFAASGFDESAILVVDGCGNRKEDLPAEEIAVARGSRKTGFEIISMYEGWGTRLKPLAKWFGNGLEFERRNGRMLPFRSLGTMFYAVADFIFGELESGKVMGLAGYGEAIFPPNSFYRTSGENITFQTKVITEVGPARVWPGNQKKHQQLAASTQAALESALIWLADLLRTKSKSDNLCFAGGVALNSIANERIANESGFKNLYVIPAAEDSGPAIGAAYYGYWQLTGSAKKHRIEHDAFGREYSMDEIDQATKSVPYICTYRTDEYIEQAVDLLIDGKFIAWFEGRSELGPRALGQRSILCDPRRKDAKDLLNSRIKFRESFRPFAPSILLEHVTEWFESNGKDGDSPFMLRVRKFNEDKKDLVPAVVHVDGTGRLQTLTAERNRSFYELVSAFYRRTGVPILLNTSLNVKGEPIVETPEDALWCLLATGLDACVFPRRIVKKEAAFDSILSLRPQIRMKSRSLKLKAPGNPIQKNRKGQTYLETKTDTPWGESTLNLWPALLDLFSLIDGKRDGRQILRQLKRQGYQDTEQSLVLLFVRLRRHGLIEFIRTRR